MGLCATKQDPQVLSKDTHKLGQGTHGTLIFTAELMEQGRVEDGKLDEGQTFGLEVNYHDIQLGPLIGEGSYGEVYKATYRGVRCALKRIFLPDDDYERQDNIADFLKEVKVSRIA